MGQMSELHIQINEEIHSTITDVIDGEIGYLDGFIALEETKKKLNFA